MDTRFSSTKDFWAWSRDQFSRDYNAVANATKGFLRNRLSGRSPEALEQTLEGLMNGGSLIPSSPGEPTQNENEAIVVSKAHSQHKQYEIAYLFVNLPSSRSIRTEMYDSRTGTYTPRYMTIDQDLAGRHILMQHCRSAFFGIVQDPQKYKCAEDADIMGYEELKNRIKTFMQTEGKEAKNVVILINGHGSPQGICFEKEERPIEWNKLKDDIKKLRSEAEALPAGAPSQCILRLFLVNCFAHLARRCKEGGKSDDTMILHTLTSEENENLDFIYFFDRFSDKFIDPAVKVLNAKCPDLMAEIKEFNELMRQKLENEAGRGPATEMNPTQMEVVEVDDGGKIETTIGMTHETSTVTTSKALSEGQQFDMSDKFPVREQQQESGSMDVGC